MLRSGIHLHMGGADCIEPLLYRGPSEFRLVAIPAEVAEKNVLQIRSNEFGEHRRSRLVTEMPVAAHDALLYAPGPSQVVLQHFHIVVSFEDKNVRLANSILNELGGVAEISEKTDHCSFGAQCKPDRVVSIMRDGERFHADFAHLEGSPGVEQAEIEFRALELQFHSFLGQAIAENGDRQFIAKCAEAVRVVSMFVGEKDSAQAFRRAADLRESFANLLGAKTGVDQETRVAIFEIGAITIRSAAKDRELYRQ